MNTYRTSLIFIEQLFKYGRVLCFELINWVKLTRTVTSKHDDIGFKHKNQRQKLDHSNDTLKTHKTEPQFQINLFSIFHSCLRTIYKVNTIFE